LQLVDLQWVALAGWREQVKLVFDRVDVLRFLPSLCRVTVHASIAGNSTWCAAANLFVGWLAARLGLQLHSPSGDLVLGEPAYGRVSANCVLPQRSVDFEFELESLPSSKESAISRVEFGFHPEVGATDGAEHRVGSIVLEAKEALDTHVELPGLSLHFTRPFDEASTNARLLRLFLVGESMMQYHVALQGALTILGLGINPDAARPLVGARSL